MMPRGVRRLVMLALGTLIVGALVLVAVRGEAMLLDLTAAIAAFCL
ncbi:MAG TPA: hypothetical protein PK264_11865 [Hyphomicrobiaceae bacterium]|nr:hypothetical protein [Hyphomicrobiaceae bacterium]